MKNIASAALILCAFILQSRTITSTGNTPAVTFIQNRGQVHDQHHLARPDVLFSASAGNMICHLKQNGISYQLSRPDVNSKPEHGIKSRIKIYRVDLNWVGSSLSSSVKGDNVCPGVSNYYLANCPSGAIGVQTFNDIWYSSLYEGIDLHYYSKGGTLKYDYIVKPGADYTKIRIGIEGAQIKLLATGDVEIVTPFGKIVEGRPIVYQEGRRISASWHLENNVLSFFIPHADNTKEILIDPAVRTWGTFFGDNSNEQITSSSVDNSGNVYVGGHTQNMSSGGTALATSGAHQTTFGGSSDAFLAKFSSSGSRLWSTYYGSVYTDEAYGCSLDGSGNIYLCGGTYSSSTVFSTSGAYKSSSTEYDAFLVKFNSSGVRQWGTYFGGSDVENAEDCSVDASGNVYITGTTKSTTGIASSGAHQTSHSGSMEDGYIAKFTSSGTFLWGTYYGGMNVQTTLRCKTDGSGNVLITGITETGADAVLASSGAHQTTFGGGTTDIFIAKFNSSGTRQWGTLYGGSNAERPGDICTDASGNVYISATTTSTESALATSGTQQSVTAGSYEALIVKFNSSGSRQWGTFYGSSNYEGVNTCELDGAGNIYISGYGLGSTALSTSGSHQTSHGGGIDCFIAKFSNSGLRIWGSYLGGGADETCLALSVTSSGDAYMSGWAQQPSLGDVNKVESPNGFQTTFGGGIFDGFIVKFTECASMGLTATGSKTLCAGGTATISAMATSTSAVSYTWNGPASFASTSATVNLANLQTISSGIYTVTANAGGCIEISQVTITVNQNPVMVVAASAPAACMGGVVTLTASGATSYLWSNGTTGPVISFTVTPNNNTLTVTGSTQYSCSAIKSVTIGLNPSPSVTIAALSPSVCAGSSINLIAVGALTYSWSQGGSAPIVVVTPGANTTYSVTGFNQFGCKGVATISITAVPYPVLSTTAPSAPVCANTTVTLTASGASSYNWSNGSTAQALVVTPAATTSYTVTGNNSGCETSAVVTVSVDACLSLSETSWGSAKVFPNPVSDVINIVPANGEMLKFELTNSLGQILRQGEISGASKINISALPGSVYFLTLRSAGKSETVSIVKE